MEHLFDGWVEMAQQLSRAQRVVLLCDFDGTLSPIVERPEDAALAPGIRECLQRLAVTSRYSVGFISGRALSDLKARVAVRHAIYAGNHGLEIEGPGRSFLHPISREVVPVFKLLDKVLRKGMSAVKGAVVENKGLTIAVHYRGVAPDAEQEVGSILHRIVSVPLALGRLRITRGKKVMEVRPMVDWDKGKAVSYIVTSYLQLRVDEKIKVVFLGDDLTDEDAFRVVNGYNGLSIRVGDEERPTDALYRLRTVDEVLELLKRMVAEERRLSVS